MKKANDCSGGVTLALDSIVDGFDFGEQSKCLGQLLLFAVILAASAQPVFMFITLRDDVHINHWLSPAMAWLNLAVPVMLLAMYFLFLCMNCRQSSRFIKGTLFCWFSMIGGILVLTGAFTLTHFVMVSDSLRTSCGKGITMGVQEEWRRLHAFHEKCKKTQSAKDMFIQQCPGFSSMEAAPHRAVVDYIEDMELDYNCRGFCEPNEPLFVEARNEEGTCAEAVGVHVYNVGLEVGFPMMIVGSCLVLLGLCLTNYKHL